MARFMGRDGVVQVDVNSIGQITEYEYTDDRSVARAAVMGAGFVGHGIGNPTVTGTIRCLIDPADTGQQNLDSVLDVSLTFRPQGTGSGLPEETLASAYISSIANTIPSEEFATVEFSFVADSALVKSTQS